MLPHLVTDHLEHGAVPVGIEEVPHVEPEGFVAVDGDSRREKFPGISSALRKEVRHLAALHIDDCDILPLSHLHGGSAAGGDKIFPHSLRSFRMM